VVDRESKWHRNMATDLAALGCWSRLSVRVNPDWK
jgi:hypothetical protein